VSIYLQFLFIYRDEQYEEAKVPGPSKPTAAAEVLQPLKSKMWTDPKKIAVLDEDWHSEYVGIIAKYKPLNAKKMFE